LNISCPYQYILYVLYKNIIYHINFSLALHFFLFSKEYKKNQGVTSDELIPDLYFIVSYLISYFYANSAAALTTLISSFSTITFTCLTSSSSSIKSVD